MRTAFPNELHLHSKIAMKGAADHQRAPPALGAFFDEHFDYVWEALCGLGIHEADREGLMHDIFLRVHSRIADYDRTRLIRPWLFGVAYRVAAHHHRLARRRIEVLGTPADVEVGRIRPDDGLHTPEERELLLSALHTLDLGRRAVLVMHDLDGTPDSGGGPHPRYFGRDGVLAAPPGAPAAGSRGGGSPEARGERVDVGRPTSGAPPAN